VGKLQSVQIPQCYSFYLTTLVPLIFGVDNNNLIGHVPLCSSTKVAC